MPADLKNRSPDPENGVGAFLFVPCKSALFTSGNFGRYWDIKMGAAAAYGAPVARNGPSAGAAEATTDELRELLSVGLVDRPRVTAKLEARYVAALRELKTR